MITEQILDTPKKNPLKYEDLKEFIECFNAKYRAKRKETWNAENENGRWRKFTSKEITARDKTNLDIFWLKDDTMIDLDNLPEPDDLINDIIENIESVLVNYKTIRDSIS